MSIARATSRPLLLTCGFACCSFLRCQSGPLQTEPKEAIATDASSGLRERRARKPRPPPSVHPPPNVESVSHRLRRYRNRLIDVWEGNEPRIHSRLNRMIATIQRRKMEAPLVVLGTLLVLWASVAFVTWMAFPHAGKFAQPNVEMSRPAHPSPGMSTGVPAPSTMEALHSYSTPPVATGQSMAEKLESAKQHIEDRIPGKPTPLGRFSQDWRTTVEESIDRVKSIAVTWSHSLWRSIEWILGGRMPDSSRGVKNDAPLRAGSSPPTGEEDRGATPQGAQESVDPRWHQRQSGERLTPMDAERAAHVPSGGPSDSHAPHSHHPHPHMVGHEPEEHPVIYMHHGHGHFAERRR